MSRDTTMTPRHPRWTELLEQLEKVERCERNTAHTQAILESMGEVDVASSLLALRALGGDCDCAILYDVTRNPERAARLTG